MKPPNNALQRNVTHRLRATNQGEMRSTLADHPRRFDRTHETGRTGQHRGKRGCIGIQTRLEH